MNIGAYTAGRDNNFNLIRFLAAFAVLLSHSFPIVYGSDANEPLIALGLGITLGELAVDIFFVTSGFLVFASLMRSKNLFVFSVARGLRIFPGLLAMLVIVVFWIGPLLSTATLGEYFTHIETIQYFVINATLLPAIYFGGHDWLPGLFANNAFKNSVNGSLWTLPIELVMYIGLGGMWAFSWVARHKRSTLLVFTVLSTCAALCALAIFTQIISVRWYGKVAEMAYMFFCGSTLYILRNHIRLSRSAALVAAAVLLVAAGIGSKAFHVVYLILLPYLLLYLAYVPKGVLRRFNRMGDYSYGIYIYAFPIQQAVAAMFPGVTVFGMIGISGVITLALAVGSWHLIEKRAMTIGGRKRRESVSPIGIAKV